MKIKNSEKEVKLYKIDLRVNNKKSSKGIKFRDYYTYLNMYDENHKDVKVPHYIKVKFTREVPHTDLEQIKTRGIIEVYSNEINLPSSYYLVKTDEKGNKVYPCIWIHKIESYESKVIVQDQDVFSTDNDFSKKSSNKESNQESIETDSFDI